MKYVFWLFLFALLISASCVYGQESDRVFARPGVANPSADIGVVRPDRDTTTDRADDSTSNGDDQRFHWKPALTQSMVFLGIQHSLRMFAPKTRAELGGPFFKDWMKSEKNMRGWEDGDSGFTNYVSHPFQGSLTGRIFVNNSDIAKKQEFGSSPGYWRGRFKAMMWSLFWSTQYELGPISEASIGNVGLRDHNGHCTMAYVDLVITPTVGTAVLVGEDAIDRYLLKNGIERGSTNKRKIAILRTLLTPTTSAANVLRWEKPWKRDDRPL